MATRAHYARSSLSSPSAAATLKPVPSRAAPERAGWEVVIRQAYQAGKAALEVEDWDKVYREMSIVRSLRPL